MTGEQHEATLATERDKGIMIGYNSKRTFIILLAVVVILMMAILHAYPSVYRVQQSSFRTVPSLGRILTKRPTMSPARKRNEERKVTLRRTCEKFGDRVPRLTNDSFTFFSKSIIVDRERRIMYCPVPKAACTTWKAFFIELRGIEVKGDVHDQERTSVLHLSDMEPAEREFVLRNFTKFIVVRHPFTRILSAFRNKLEPNGSFETNHANNSELVYYWRDRLGWDILKIYRGKETAKRFKEHREEYELTFKEFIDYILDHRERIYANDRHWKEMHSICYPCDIEYDFIAKTETLANDSILFLVSNGLSTHVKNYEHHATHSSTSTAVYEFFNKLPVDSIEKVYKRYEMDFKLFGYDPRKFDER